MFEPKNRETYTSYLIPPLDYRLERAVAMTYSLDLETLMASILALVRADIKTNNDGRPQIQMLPAIKAVAHRLTVYCQKGKLRMGVRKPHPLYGALDEIVRNVAPPGESFFHPKIWVLKYVSSEPGEMKKGPLYRLLVSSRNISKTRTYFESIVCLEGRGGPSRTANQSLRNLLTHYGATDKGVPELAAELATVAFEAPSQQGTVEIFVQIGGEKHTALEKHLKIEKYERVAVISPFVQPNFLKKITAKKKWLVALEEQLELLPNEVVSSFAAFSVLDREPSEAELDQGVEASENGEQHLDVDQKAALCGLHAKIVVGERDKTTDIWIGSANATGVAWNGSNTEVMIVLRDVKYSVEKLVADFILRDPASKNAKDKPHRWIKRFKGPVSDARRAEIFAEQDLSWKIDAYIRWLCAQNWHVAVSPTATGLSGRISLQTVLAPFASDDIEILSTTVSILGSSASVKLAAICAGGADLLLTSIASASEFLQFHITLRSKHGLREEHKVSFLHKADTEFDRDARDRAIMDQEILTKGDFITCLRSLLAGYVPPDETESIPVDPLSPPPPGSEPVDEDKHQRQRTETTINWSGILEDLLRDVARDPAQFQTISKFIEVAPADKVAPEFLQLWTALRDAYLEAAA